MSLRVILVGGGVLVREGLKAILAMSNGVDVISDHPNADEALRNLDVGVDLCLVVLPCDGFPKLIERMRSINARIVLVSGKDRYREMSELWSDNIAAVLDEDMAGEDLVRAVHLASRGLIVFSGGCWGTLRHALSTLPDIPAEVRLNPPRFTSREREVLELLSRGLSNQEIARVLCISVPAARDHVVRIMRKLRQPTRELAVLCARRLGLLAMSGESVAVAAGR